MLKALEVLKKAAVFSEHSTHYPSLSDFDEAIAELEALGNRSCEGCKYSKEEMDRLTKKTLQLISPKHGDKYSPNLYKWLVENFREREFETKVFVNSDGIRFIGFFDDAGWFFGASLMGVLRNGEKEKPRPVPPIRVKDYREIEGFWNAYEKDGVVTITPPPRPLPDIPELEALESRSCEGCKYSKEEMDRLRMQDTYACKLILATMLLSIFAATNGRQNNDT